ncbi:hypothetical protein LINGRAPRIM_LOCUS2263 [Linum grandiflorum]
MGFWVGLTSLISRTLQPSLESQCRLWGEKRNTEQVTFFRQNAGLASFHHQKKPPRGTM